MLRSLLSLAFRPDASRLIKRGLALRQQGRLPEAMQVLRRAVARFPRDAVAATNLAIVLLEQDCGQEGTDLLQQALDCDPRCGAAHYNLANVLRAMGRHDEAIAHYRFAVQFEPQLAPAREELMHTLLEVCDWSGAQVEADSLSALVSAHPAAEWMRCISPLTAVCLGLDADRCKQVAAYHSAERAQDVASARRPKPVGVGAPDRLRIGYLSRDFRNHPVGQLMRSIFSLHDHNRFEVTAFSHGPDDGSPYRAAIAADADHFVDIAGKTDAQAAADIAAAGVHVLIDLAGHTTGNRLGLLARRPAPVQVHYLGYPATTGAGFVDYFITDHVATPPQCAAQFTERLAYVPRCFMVGGAADAQATSTDSRAAHGLPEDATVLCNFGSASRITRDVFRLWMEILRRAPSAILWLGRTHDMTMQNLRSEAQRSGIDSRRLIFAQRVAGKPQHLSRLALADLGLDTVGWHNGHSSTSDLLWAGVPVLTFAGATFASRVAASLLSAAGLPELAVRDTDEYVKTAARLAVDRVQCTALKCRLALNRQSAPFFDERGLVADLEAVYVEMERICRAGEAPRTIDV